MTTPDPYKSKLYQRNRRLVLEQSRFRCQICGNRAVTCDHVRPLAMGGTHDIANLRALCWSCNSRLGAEVTNAIKAARKVGRHSRRW